MAELLFSEFADVNPFTAESTPPIPAGYVATTASDPARIGSFLWYRASGTDTGLRETTAFTGTQYGAAVQVGVTASDSHGPMLVNDTDTGYKLLVRDTDLRLYKVVNGVLGAQVLPALSISVPDDAVVELWQNESTNAQTAYIDDEPVQAWGDTTYTEIRYPGCFSRGGTIKSLTSEQIASGPSITNINGDNTVVQGSADNTLVTTLLTVSTLSIGGIAVTPAEVDENNHTWDMPGFVDTEVYPEFGTVEAAVNTDEAVLNITLELDPDYTDTIMGTLSEADDCIATAAAAEGLTIVATDTLYNIAGLTIYDDSTISDADDGTHIVWHRAAATNVMTQINLIVSGGVIVTGNLTARALTARSITSRSLTVRHL